MSQKQLKSDRLFEERRKGTSPNLIAGQSTEFDRAKGQLTAFAETFIIEECLSAAQLVDKDFMERRLLSKFMRTRGWHESLEVRLNNGHMRWVHCIAWAREKLAHPAIKILVTADQVPGRHYLLVKDAEEAARKKLHERDIEIARSEKEKGFSAPKKTRTRVATEVEESDAVYIIIDPKRAGCCKIGSGNGKCLERLREARLWTNGEAQLQHVEPVGSGNGFRVENSVRFELGRKGHRVNGEWVECKFSTAVPVIEAWGRKAREQASAEGQSF